MSQHTNASASTAPHFANADELVAWLDTLRATTEDGAVIANLKWEPAQRAIAAIRASAPVAAAPADDLRRAEREAHAEMYAMETEATVNMGRKDLVAAYVRAREELRAALQQRPAPASPSVRLDWPPCNEACEEGAKNAMCRCDAAIKSLDQQAEQRPAPAPSTNYAVAVVRNAKLRAALERIIERPSLAVELATEALAQQAEAAPAPTAEPRTKLWDNTNDEGEVGWYFDCDGHYIDVERDKEGKYSIYFRNRADESEAWLDQAEAPAPVAEPVAAVKPWRERFVPPKLPDFGSIAAAERDAMLAEIADWRAAHATTTEKIPCPGCYGMGTWTGQHDGYDDADCHMCNGAGKVAAPAVALPAAPELPPLQPLPEPVTPDFMELRRYFTAEQTESYAREYGKACASAAVSKPETVCAENCFYGDCPPCVEAGLRPAIAASRAMPAPDQWQSIATAPHDDLLLLAYEFDRPGDWRIKVGGYWNGAWEVFGASWTPTRWMPLPAPPAGSDRAALADPQPQQKEGEA